MSRVSCSVARRAAAKKGDVRKAINSSTRYRRLKRGLGRAVAYDTEYQLDADVRNVRCYYYINIYTPTVLKIPDQVVGVRWHLRTNRHDTTTKERDNTVRTGKK